MKDQWDIYEPLGFVPAPGEDLEILAPPKDGTCKMPA
jgi:branched-chain amino acid transport system substrate-binding protein